ncbi:FCD domain-containing protein [Advenella sp. RU8]|uniref:FCD domain-containing protein n=1 Tax=Advenella sp. RU8 TaxID=3399575 RepID=UPI003AB09C07
MSSPDAITLLRTRSLTTLVHEELERQILQGLIQPGDALREATIATNMGISRGPVREAFRTLEERGLVLFEKNCGVSVRKLDSEQAAQIYQVRIPLEALIGQLVTVNLPPEGRDQIERLIAHMQIAVNEQNIVTYATLNQQFHDMLAKYTNNFALYDTYRKLVVQLKLFRSHTFRHSPETIKLSLEEHIAIFNAITSGNEDKASDLLRKHAEDSLQRLNATIHKQ